MPGKEQLGNKPEEADLSLPQKDQEAYVSRFGLTRDIIKHLQDAGISERSYDRFIRGFDAYLKHSATTENLNAIGVIAVPSNEGAASMIVEDGGFVLNAVTYWSLPNETFSWFNEKKLNPAVSTNHNEWIDLGDIPDKELVTTFNYVPLSSEDYSTLEQVQIELENPAIRREKFTLSVDLANGICEFWGLVTIKQLRQEMANLI